MALVTYRVWYGCRVDNVAYKRGIVVQLDDTSASVQYNVSKGRLRPVADELAGDTVTSATILDNEIVNADVASDAAIAATKIAGTAVTQADTGTVTSGMIANDTIVDADINSSAAIAATKISGTALVASTVDAKGDLLAATADNTVARLAVGSDGTALVADASQSSGISWRAGKWRTESTTVTVTGLDQVIDVTGTTTVNLPAAASHTGRVYIIRNTGTDTVTLDGNAAETVGGSATLAIAGKGFVTVVSNGSAWLVIDGKYESETVGRRQWTWNAALATPGWQQTYGDTGWRDVTASLANGWTATAVLLRREGSRVSLFINGLDSASATDDVFLTASGFGIYGLGGTANGFVPWSVSGGVVNFVTITTSAPGQFAIGRAGFATTLGSASGQRVTTWTTNDSWPTTLPGSASGSIPS